MIPKRKDAHARKAVPGQRGNRDSLQLPGSRLTRRQCKLRWVALAFPFNMPWMALFARGAVAYADQHGGWTFSCCPPKLSGGNDISFNLHNLKGWPGDGAIAALYNASDARIARGLNIPVVNVSGVIRSSSLPRVMVDHYAIGRMGAEHLLECGLLRLAFCGDGTLWYARQRCLGFVDRARQAGAECDVLDISCQSSSRDTWQRRIAPLSRWLKRLKTPVGMMAMHDHRAQFVMDECIRLGLIIPHDVAVIGSDNDVMICEFSRPTLSTVSRNAWRVGYEAAALLDRMMKGKSPPKEDTLIPPDGVVERQSTATFVVDDPEVAAAVHFMHDHIGEPFGIKHVMREMCISRRELELRFHRFLHTTPHEYLRRMRVERLRRLLSSPQCAKMQSIATACGFSSVRRMRDVFFQSEGMTPSEYRTKWLRENHTES